MRLRRISLKNLVTAMASLFLAAAFPLSCAAEINPAMIDRYLQREFDWAMYVDCQDLKHYLDYKGSRLNPVSLVRVSFRPFPRGLINAPTTESAVYEEFWYHRGQVLGMRRHRQLNFDPTELGAIIISPKPDGSLDKPESTEAIANVLMRLMVDLQLKRALISVVLVPTDRYDEVAGGIGKYHFYRNPNVTEGQQMNVHLRAYPSGPDDYFYYRNSN